MCVIFRLAQRLLKKLKKKDILKRKVELAKSDWIFASACGIIGGLRRKKIECLKKSDLNKNLSKDAQGLTDALRGNKKLQGNWGEFQLERVLEISGLQKDINYTTQENFKDGEDKNRRPDVIIYMPDNRNIIVDSKVSLNDYMDYANCDGSLEEKEHLLSRHVDCIKRPAG